MQMLGVCEPVGKGFHGTEIRPRIVADEASGHHREMTILYGIPNCDTVKRARAWLDEHGVTYRFHDFKKDGVPEAELDQWLKSPGWETLVNRRGTTWRRLDEAARAAVVDVPSARAALIAHPSLIKRPVVQWDGGATVTAGFDASDWENRVKSRVKSR
jgi:Spx/MgsR family transcriptional regulator